MARLLADETSVRQRGRRCPEALVTECVHNRRWLANRHLACNSSRATPARPGRAAGGAKKKAADLSVRAAGLPGTIDPDDAGAIGGRWDREEVTADVYN
jgi:hypothetical protein